MLNAIGKHVVAAYKLWYPGALAIEVKLPFEINIAKKKNI